MAIRRYSRRTSGMRRPVRRSARQYRWAVVVGTNTVTAGQFATLELLSSAQPAPTIADSIYQQMTHPTLIAVMGHMTVASSQTYVAGTTRPPGALSGAWGIYVDKDFSSAATALPAYSAGFTSTWMVHKPFRLTTPTYLAGSANVVIGDNDLNYRRYELNLRKYKRKLDSFSDSLILSIENVGGAESPILTYDFYFRLLLLE